MGRASIEQETGMDAVRAGRGGTYLEVQLRPGARRDRVLDWVEGALRVEVGAPALEERANRALVALMAKVLKVPKGSVALTKGAHGRRKTLHIDGYGPAEILARLPERPETAPA